MSGVVKLTVLIPARKRNQYGMEKKLDQDAQIFVKSLKSAAEKNK